MNEKKRPSQTKFLAEFVERLGENHMLDDHGSAIIGIREKKIQSRITQNSKEGSS